jgi:hypothetical protein
MSRTHRLVVVQVPPSVFQARKDTASRSATDEGDGVHLHVARSASSIDDIDHIFVTSQNEDGEEAFRIDSLATSDEQAAARLTPSLTAACFGPPSSSGGSPGGSNLSRDAMVFCAATPRVDQTKIDGKGQPTAFAEQAAGIGTQVAHQLSHAMLDSARDDHASKSGSPRLIASRSLTVVAYTMLVYDLQPFAGFSHSAVDLLQEISEDMAPRKLPLGTMDDGERIEGATFVDGLIEAECDLSEEPTKTQSLLTRILNRISEGRAKLARSPAICLGIGWAPIASVIRMTVEPTRRSLTIIELEGSLFVAANAGPSPAMLRTFEALEAFVKHGLQAGGDASDGSLLRLLLDKALSNASTPWWTVFGNAVISGSLLSQPWVGTVLECSPWEDGDFGDDGEGQDTFDEATKRLLRFTRHFFPVAPIVESDEPTSPTHTTPSSPADSDGGTEPAAPQTPLSLDSPPENALVVQEEPAGDDEPSLVHEPDAGNAETRRNPFASGSTEPLIYYLETQRHLSDALRKEQETRLTDMEGLRCVNNDLRSERTGLLEKLRQVTLERDKFRDNFLLEQYEAQVMRTTLETLRTEKLAADTYLQRVRAPRPLLRDAFKASWERLSRIQKEVESLTNQLDLARISEKSLKESLEASQAAHAALLESHRQCTHDWKEEETRLKERVAAAEASMLAYPMTTGDYYGLIDESGTAESSMLSVGHLLSTMDSAATDAGITLYTGAKASDYPSPRRTFQTKAKSKVYSKKAVAKAAPTPADDEDVGGLPDAISFWTKFFAGRSLVPWSPDFENALWDVVFAGNFEGLDADAMPSDTTKQHQVALFAGTMQAALCDGDGRVSYTSFISYTAALHATDMSFKQALVKLEDGFAGRSKMLYVTALDPTTLEEIPSSRSFVMVREQDTLVNVRKHLNKVFEDDEGTQSGVELAYSFHLFGIGGKTIATIMVPRSQEHQISCADLLESGIGVVQSPATSSNALRRALSSEPARNGVEQAGDVEVEDGNGDAEGKSSPSKHQQERHQPLSERDADDARRLISSAARTIGGDKLVSLFDHANNNSGRLDDKDFQAFVRQVLRVPARDIDDQKVLGLFSFIDRSSAGTIQIHELLEFVYQPSASPSPTRSPASPPVINRGKHQGKKARVVLHGVDPRKSRPMAKQPGWNRF